MRVGIIFLMILVFCGCESVKRWGNPNFLQNPNNYESRREYLDAHPELLPPIAQAIRRGTVVTGMTKEAVQASLGKPADTDYNVDFQGRVYDELWIYAEGSATTAQLPQTLVYFLNDKVEKIAVN